MGRLRDWASAPTADIRTAAKIIRQFERTGHGASLWCCVYMLRVQGAVLAFFSSV
jgi:hypothetical protein